jgi:hypothetical protein
MVSVESHTIATRNKKHFETIPDVNVFEPD